MHFVTDHLCKATNRISVQSQQSTQDLKSKYFLKSHIFADLNKEFGFDQGCRKTLILSTTVRHKLYNHPMIRRACKES